MNRLIWCLVYFTIFGPMIGFVSASTLVGVFDSEGISIRYATNIVLGMLFATVVSIPALPGAILVGGVPALLTGSIYWSWRRKFCVPTSQSVVISGMTGGGVCAVIATAANGSLQDSADIDLWKVFVLPGVIAGSLTAWLVERRVWSRTGSVG